MPSADNNVITLALIIPDNHTNGIQVFCETQFLTHRIAEAKF